MYLIQGSIPLGNKKINWNQISYFNSFFIS